MKITTIASRFTQMSKKSKFLISSGLLLLGFIGIQFIGAQHRLLAIILLTFFSLILSFWSFYESLAKDMTLVSLILPTFFTFGVGIFWFLLPVNIFSRVPIVIFFTLGTYSLLSTMNIFTVSSTLKTIALFHAAKGVGFVLSLITSFLIFDAILSIKQSIAVNSILVFLTSFFIFLQGFWSVVLDKKINITLFKNAFFSSIVMGELAVLIFFWPVTVVVGSLFLTGGVYLLLGLGQAKLEEKLFSSTVKEYLTIGIVVLLSVLLATKWGM